MQLRGPAAEYSGRIEVKSDLLAHVGRDLGPGELELAHQTDEYCVVLRITPATEIYTAIIRDWCTI